MLIAKSNLQRLTHLAVRCYWDDLSKRIQQYPDFGNLHGLYSGIREAISPTPKRSYSILPRVVDELLFEPSSLLNCRVEHYTWTYCASNDFCPYTIASLYILPTFCELDNPFSVINVKAAIEGLKNNKFSELDNILPEVLKTGGKIVIPSYITFLQVAEK